MSPWTEGEVEAGECSASAATGSLRTRDFVLGRAGWGHPGWVVADGYCIRETKTRVSLKAAASGSEEGGARPKACGPSGTAALSFPY